MLGVTGYVTKKQLKADIGTPFEHVMVETSMFGPEYKGDGQYAVVGPCAFTKRRWYATVTVKDGKIYQVD
jgi:hypothetical protein